MTDRTKHRHEQKKTSEIRNRRPADTYMASFRFKKSEKNPVIKVKKKNEVDEGAVHENEKKKTKQNNKSFHSLYDIIVGYDSYCLYTTRYVFRLFEEPPLVRSGLSPALH